MEEMRYKQASGSRRYAWFLLPTLVVLVVLVLVLVSVSLFLTLKGKKMEAQPEGEASHALASKTVAPSTTPCPPSNCSRMSCTPEESFDANGCPYCKCADPHCEGVRCPKGSRCFIGNRPSADGNAWLESGPLCLQVQKPGSCPPVHKCKGAAADCWDDADCDRDLKCCNFACDRNQCMEPAGVCSLAHDRGIRCGNVTWMWYYHNQLNNCIKFPAFPCGGNSNRFRSEEDCLERCKIHMD